MQYGGDGLVVASAARPPRRVVDGPRPVTGVPVEPGAELIHLARVSPTAPECMNCAMKSPPRQTWSIPTTRPRGRRGRRAARWSAGPDRRRSGSAMIADAGRRGRRSRAAGRPRCCAACRGRPAAGMADEQRCALRLARARRRTSLGRVGEVEGAAEPDEPVDELPAEARAARRPARRGRRRTRSARFHVSPTIRTPSAQKASSSSGIEPSGSAPFEREHEPDRPSRRVEIAAAETPAHRPRYSPAARWNARRQRERRPQSARPADPRARRRSGRPADRRRPRGASAASARRTGSPRSRPRRQASSSSRSTCASAIQESAGKTYDARTWPSARSPGRPSAARSAVLTEEALAFVAGCSASSTPERGELLERARRAAESGSTAGELPDFLPETATCARATGASPRPRPTCRTAASRSPARSTAR